jgi:Autographiviridae endonuclease VII
MADVFRPDAQRNPNEKRCIKCNEMQPLSNFYAQAGMRDGYRNDCKSCMAAYRKKRYAANPDVAIQRVRKWRERYPERYREGQRRYREEHGEQRRQRDRAGHLRRKYGLRAADYDFLVVAQGGLCAICGQPDERGLHVDHEHATGLVRGLLCGRCNKAIGLLDEDPLRFESAKDYLRRAQLPLGCGDRKAA